MGRSVVNSSRTGAPSQSVVHGTFHTFPVFWSVEPRGFLGLATQGLAVLIEKHLPLEDWPFCVVAEGRNLTASVPVAHAHQWRVYGKGMANIRVVKGQVQIRAATGPNELFSVAETNVSLRVSSSLFYPLNHFVLESSGRVFRTSRELF